ncbi:cysteine-rich receptor-like protein kinase 20 [Tanacetum coccineum]
MSQAGLVGRLGVAEHPLATPLAPPLCDDENYTQNSPYKQNLDDVLYALIGTNNGFGFYSSTSGFYTQNSPYKQNLCRGDIEPESCRRCVDDATRRLRQVCPNEVQASGWYDMCFLKYSNGSMARGIGLVGNNPNNVSDSSFDQWNQSVANLLGVLRPGAVGGGQLRKYASGNMTAGSTTLYGMMQCNPDLSATDCDDCFTTAIGMSRRYERSMGVRAFLPYCSFGTRFTDFSIQHGFPLLQLQHLESKLKKHQPQSHCRSNISGSGDPRGSLLLHFPEVLETEEKSISTLSNAWVARNLYRDKIRRETLCVLGTRSQSKKIRGIEAKSKLLEAAKLHVHIGLNTYLRINTCVPISSYELSTLNSASNVVLEGN